MTSSIYGSSVITDRKYLFVLKFMSSNHQCMVPVLSLTGNACLYILKFMSNIFVAVIQT